MNKFDIGEVWLSDSDQDEYEIVYVGEKEFVAKNLKDNALYLFHCDGKSIYDKRRLVKRRGQMPHKSCCGAQEDDILPCCEKNEIETLRGALMIACARIADGPHLRGRGPVWDALFESFRIRKPVNAYFAP